MTTCSWSFSHKAICGVRFHLLENHLVGVRILLSPPDVMVTSIRRKCGRGRVGCDGKLIWTELYKCSAAWEEKEKRARNHDNKTSRLGLIESSLMSLCSGLCSSLKLMGVLSKPLSRPRWIRPRKSKRRLTFVHVTEAQKIQLQKHEKGLLYVQFRCGLPDIK